jgi:hypothetical protein
MTSEGEHEHKEEEKKDEPQAEKKEEHGHDEHAGHSHPAVKPFTDAQIADMHASDRYAARNIILLLMGIFLIGVGIYAYVAAEVARGWWG